MAAVLIVDDIAENLHLLTELLLPFYRVRAVNSGERAIKAAQASPPPDLILLDVMMPQIDGYDVLRALKKDPRTSDIPVIFVTALDGSEDEAKGLELGAVDYITKPFKPAITLARIRAHLELKSARDQLADHNRRLEEEVRQRMAENLQIQDISILALGHLAEIRDPETGNHLKRTQEYIRVLCEYLKPNPRFTEFLTDSNIDLLVKSAPLHDIGKVGIPDSILLKPGPLNEEEWVIMRTHAQLGQEAIEKAQSGFEKQIPFLEFAKIVAVGHHEKWNGSGYPNKLKGDEIPIPARLMALADVFDALTSRRPYKEPFSVERSTQIIQDGRSTHFDPDIVDAFLASTTAFADIAARYADSDEEVVQKLHQLAGRR